MSTDNDMGFDDEVRVLYEKYLKKTAADGVEHVPYDVFHEFVLSQTATMMAAQSAAKTMKDAKPGEDMLFVAIRVADAKQAVQGSIIRQCSQCQSDVYVDPRMALYLAKSKAIICNQCMPEVTGDKFDDVIRKKMNDLNDEEEAAIGA